MRMNCSIKHPTKKIAGHIQLPSSKSISNRALIIQALCPKPFQIHNLSTAKDTVVLQKALKENSSAINIGDAGTAMRFLTAFLSTQESSFTIDGSSRMRERPIQLLVDALRQLGATIDYLGESGFPPLKVSEKCCKGGSISLNGSISSQYLSALLMIAPTLEGGLNIHLEGTIVSKPYIAMTLDMMRYFGVESQWEGNNIYIKEQSYQAKDICIEADWSAAAFWFELVALAEEATISLAGLHPNSWQGDQAALQLFAPLGVKHKFTGKGLQLHKGDCEKKLLSLNLIETPDLAQALACTIAGLNKSATLKGLQTLSIKETDRLTALQRELNKFGIETIIDHQSIQIPAATIKTPRKPLASYNDHRMLMCLAPMALLTGELTIEDMEVVHKSYPHFWSDLKKVGFELKY